MWSVCRTAIADLHHFNEEQNPDPLQSKNRIRISMEVKKNPNSDPQKVMWENDSENNTYLTFCGPYHSKI
jgi:hypothetical protein